MFHGIFNIAVKLLLLNGIHIYYCNIKYAMSVFNILSQKNDIDLLKKSCFIKLTHHNKKKTLFFIQFLYFIELIQRRTKRKCPMPTTVRYTASTVYILPYIYIYCHKYCYKYCYIYTAIYHKKYFHLHITEAEGKHTRACSGGIR